MKKLKKVAVFLSLIILYSNNCIAASEKIKEPKKSIGKSLFKITKNSKKKRRKKRKRTLALQGLSFGVDENTLEAIDDLKEAVNKLPKKINQETKDLIKAANQEARNLIKTANEKFKDSIKATEESTKNCAKATSKEVQAVIWYAISRGCSGFFFTVVAIMIVHKLLNGKTPIKTT